MNLLGRFIRALVIMAFLTASVSPAPAGELKVRIMPDEKVGPKLPSSAFVATDGSIAWNLLRGIAAASPSELLDIFSGMESKKRKRLLIQLNSPTGSLFDAMDMAKLIRQKNQHGVEVEIRAHGVMASAAIILLSSGTKGKRFVDPDSIVFIHDLASNDFYSIKKILPQRHSSEWDTIFYILRIREDPFRKKEAAIIKNLQDATFNHLSEMTGLTPENIRWLIKYETWLDASRAVELGFADEVINGSRKGAKDAK